MYNNPTTSRPCERPGSSPLFQINTDMEAKILETEKGNKDAVHLHWNEADKTWNAYGTSAENALRINPELRTLTDKVNLDGTEVTHLKVTTEQFERYGLADYCVAVDDERLELKVTGNKKSKANLK